MDYKEHLKKRRFNKYLNYLKRYLKNKRVIIYGAGELFRYIIDNYDLSDFNIIGISDRTIQERDEGKLKHNYKMIPLEKIENYNPDCIIVGILKSYDVVMNFRNKFRNIQILPLVNETFSEKLSHINLNKIKIEVSRFLLCLKIENRYRKLIKKIRKKQKIRVAFLCADTARWKAQSLYELLEKDECFEPFIIMSKLYIENKSSTRQQTKEEFIEKCDYFKSKGMKVEMGYDVENDEYLSLEQFQPDYIFYQLPFYCHPIQMPQETSKFALTAYIPYYISIGLVENRNGLVFRSYLHRYYVFDKSAKDYYKPLMINNGKNIKITGHTALDFYKDLPERKETDRIKVLYCPHHSIEKDSPLKYSTFLENGQLILDFAKQHPEIEWIFRPHPLLKNVLKLFWEQKDIDKYYNEWQKIGRYDGEGDYAQTFIDSYAIINDSGFMLEYFATENSGIQMLNKNAAKYDKTTEEVIFPACYISHNNEELLSLMDLLLVQRKDPKKEQRMKVIQDLGLQKGEAAKNILDDMKKELKIK